jgi:hypothetical protein
MMMKKEPESLSQVERLARQLPREIQPVIDFWPEIEAQIDIPPQDQVAGALRVWPRAAAAIALIAVSSLTTIVLVRETDNPVSATAEVGSQTAIIGAGLRAPDLLAMSALSDEVRDIVITNLDIVRAARADIEQALHEDPNNTGLYNCWLRVYEQEMDLLNETIWTTNRLEERVTT